MPNDCTIQADFLVLLFSSRTLFLLYMDNIIDRLKTFIENEARSCSMDFGCITPEYVYRMWGGTVALTDIAVALNVCKKELQYER